MFVVVERFLSNIIKEYGEHPVSTDGGTWYPPQACSRFLKINQHIHSSMEKSIIIERTIQYIKDITKECFDDYFPYRKKNCKLEHVLKQEYGSKGFSNRYITGPKHLRI
jgi:putative transposase